MFDSAVAVTHVLIQHYITVSIRSYNKGMSTNREVTVMPKWVHLLVHA